MGKTKHQKTTEQPENETTPEVETTEQQETTEQLDIDAVEWPLEPVEDETQTTEPVKKRGLILKETALWKKHKCVEAMNIPLETFDPETRELISTMTTSGFKTWLLQIKRPSFELFRRRREGQVSQLKADILEEKTAKENAFAEIEMLRAKLAAAGITE